MSSSNRTVLPRQDYHQTAFPPSHHHYSLPMPSTSSNASRAPMPPALQPLRSPNGAYSNNLGPRRLGLEHVERNIRSSSDPDAGINSPQGNDADESSRKRGSTEAVEYPRRRATIAVSLNILQDTGCYLLRCCLVRDLPRPEVALRRLEAKV